MRLLFSLLLLFLSLYSDEIRPGFLEIKALDATHYELLFKTPKTGEKRTVYLEVLLPEIAEVQGTRDIHSSSNAFIERYGFVIEGGLRGKSITIKGLQETSTDVLVHIVDERDVTQTIRVVPAEPTFNIASEQSVSQVAMTYLKLGVEHILSGSDHLLFVFALVLLVQRFRLLVATITAFTVAHSITLALATLELVHLSSQAVEAVIALSIMFVAAEIIYGEQGKTFVSQRWPWVIAFVFGLIHGLGFAGALREIGLPQDEIVASLLFFNVGVEMGQLAFVSLLLLLARIFRPFISRHRAVSRIVASYMIGSIASLWFLERVI